MTRDIEQTRDKLGIREMEREERKRLLKLFTEHGGRVIDEKTNKHRENMDLSSSYGKRKHENTLGQYFVGKAYGITHEEEEQARLIAQIRSSASRHHTKQGKLGGLLKIQFKGIQYRVFTVGGNRFTHGFVSEIKKSMRERFVDIALSLNSILQGEVSVINDIRRLSTGKNSTFYEVLVRLYNMYDDAEYLHIVRVIGQRTIPDDSYLPEFKEFFKKMYILGEYKNICKMCLDKAIFIQGKHNRIRRDVILSVTEQLREDIDDIFGDFFHKFHLILCKMRQIYYPLFSQEMDSFLGITDRDRIGYLTLIEKKRLIEKMKEEEVRKKTRKENEEREVEIPKHVKSGIPLLREAIEKYERLHKHDAYSFISLIDPNDSMLKVVSLLDIFDREYSFILTTGKVSFNIDYREQRKINIKQDLGNVYLLLSEAWESVKEYVDIIRQKDEMSGNFRYSQYQQYVNLKSLEKRQKSVKRHTMRKIADVMKSIESTLAIVINDYNTHKRLLQNPNETLYFDEHVDREKGVNGKKVIEAIMEAYLFSSTFTFLFNYNELSGEELLLFHNGTS
jgi:hypothetical protein